MNEKYSWRPNVFRGQKIEVRHCLPIIFGKENILKSQSDSYFKIVIEKDSIKEEVFDFDNLYTTQIFMDHHFLPPINIDYIEVEIDTNNQEYLIYNVVKNFPIFENGMNNFYKVVRI